MKTRFLIIGAAFALLVSSFSAFAQTDGRKPGIYAVIDEEYTPLAYSSGVTSNSVTSTIVDVGRTKVSYKGDHSDTRATDTFVMVIDLEKKNATKSLKEYNPFIKTMTPANIVIVPLAVNKNKRVYDEGVSVNGFNTKKKTGIPFEWEQTADNTFSIKTEKMEPGEYGIAFKIAKLGSFDFSGIFSFFVE